MNAADGSTTVFANTLDRVVDTDACNESGSCTYVVAAGHVRRITRGGAVDIPGAPLASALAVAGGRVVIVPADRSARSNPEVTPVPGGPVEIRDARTGTPLSSFHPVGTVRAVALAGNLASAVVLDAAGSKRIERYDALTGTFLGATPVSIETADVLDMTRAWVVFAAGSQIFRLDTLTGAVSPVSRSVGDPIGLSIEGRRIAWGENRRSARGPRGRIRAVIVG
jgi:hypothetical protein